MRTRAFVLAVLLSASVTLSAQENEKIKYSNITEFGITTANPHVIAFEGTTAHGFSINKTHNLGLGIGLGTGLGWIMHNRGASYMPIFLNYRLYFNPEQNRSPHVNIAAGGVYLNDGRGFYSSLTMGYKAGKFSFSSGISFAAIYGSKEIYHYIEDSYSMIYTTQVWNWYYPFGLTLKCGFTF